jgi:hypothetical protein
LKFGASALFGDISPLILKCFEDCLQLLLYEPHVLNLSVHMLIGASKYGHLHPTENDHLIGAPLTTK